jgi:hypothetical protein
MGLFACAAAMSMVGVACSSSSSAESGPANVVTGAMVGRTLDAKDAVSYTSGTSTFVAIGDYSGMCAFGTALKSESNVLVFEFGTATLAAGKIAFGADPSLKVKFTYYDTVCNGSVGETSSQGAGSVTVTKADSKGASGTFDVTINGDHVTGKFDAPTCDALNSAAAAMPATDAGTGGGTSGEGGTTGGGDTDAGMTSATGQLCK